MTRRARHKDSVNQPRAYRDIKGSARGWLLLLAALSMAHVGSPDTFFTGKAGPYDIRVSVRLPGVIPGRAQVAVRVIGATSPDAHRVSVRAAQWNVGLQGAPPPENATPVPGDPALYAAELWFMTATSYQLAVDVVGPSGPGTVIIPVLALATAERPMPPWLGGVLVGLGLFLTAGFLTIIGCAVRESVLPPGVEPDRRRRRRARVGVGVAALGVGLMLWGGNQWWAAEATSYAQSVLYRPFVASAETILRDDRRMLTLAIRDDRWTGKPVPESRYNALLPDHGKLMHLFLIREPRLDALAHLHPVARSPEALDFDASLPPVPAGRYRLYGDIVHESGYAQTLVSTVDIAGEPDALLVDPDDSWFSGAAVNEFRPQPSSAFLLTDGARVVWERGDAPIVAGDERVLSFAVRDVSGALLPVDPYMGMAAHVIVASRDQSVFAHLHPSGSISMAALAMFTAAAPPDRHAGHPMVLDGQVAIPYAFPKPGAYRLWVQIKRNGQIVTAAFDANVGEGESP